MRFATELRSLLFLCAFGLVSCAQAPDLIPLPSSGSDGLGDNNDGSGNDDGNSSGQSGICGAPQTKTFSISPSATNASNLIFLLDDSGSMTGEIQEVASKIEPFIQDLLEAVNPPAQGQTAQNLRLVLMFDTSGDAIQSPPFNGQNPFADLIDNEAVFYIRQETWSHWSDIALFKAFAPANFDQVLPDPVPPDLIDPNLGPAACNALGKYYRPRAFQMYQTSPVCISYAQQLNIRNYLTDNTPTNIVSFSDDDLSANGAPLVYEMIKGLLAPLGNNLPFYYHSVVGTSAGAGIERVGATHMALSTMTQGSIHDLRAPDYAPVFDALKRQVLFSNQSVALDCGISEERPVEVRFDGVLVPSSAYQAIAGEETVLFLPSAFTPGDELRTIQVEVKY